MVYSEHAHAVKVAKFSPTGKYVASGDAAGKVRVWAWTTPEHSLKVEVPALGADVEDLAWDAESKRLLAVGGGQTKAKAFAWDTGSNLADVVPHAKKALTCDLRPVRPFRMVTGGEDMSLQWYEGGPPFKYARALKDHANFVNCARFSPDGARLLTVSADKAGIVWDGEGATVVGRLDAAAGHAGGVYAVAWRADSRAAVTAGGDKAVKVWDLSGPGPVFPCTATYVVGARPEDMQQAVAWPAGGAVIVSASLDGTLNFFDAANVAAGPTRRLGGHQAPPTALAIDRATGRLFTGCAGGRVVAWAPADEARAVFSPAPATGDVPAKKVAGVSVAGGVLAVVSWDDKARVGDAATGALAAAVPCGGQPKGVAVNPACPSAVLVVTGAAVLLLRGGKVASTTPAPWGPTCVDVAPSGAFAAVGGADKRVHFFALAPDGSVTGESGATGEAPAAVSAVAVAPDSRSVAAGDAGREVRLYDAATREVTVSSRWMNHTTRVTGLAWAPSGARLASVSTDRRLCVWAPGADSPLLSLDLAHPQPFVACAWASEAELWTLGADGVANKRTLAL